MPRNEDPNKNGGATEATEDINDAPEATEDAPEATEDAPVGDGIEEAPEENPLSVGTEKVNDRHSVSIAPGRVEGEFVAAPLSYIGPAFYVKTRKELEDNVPILRGAELYVQAGE